MNTLSIFLYLANVIPNLSVLGFFLILIAFAFAFVLPARNVEMFSREHNPFMGLTRTITWVVLVIGLIFTTLVPSERTMYMIAASELGEIAVMNEEVQEVFNALKERILIELRPQENN